MTGIASGGFHVSVVTISRETALVFKRQLRQFFGQDLIIQVFTTPARDQWPETFPGEIVLVSGQSLLPLVDGRVSPQSRLFAARRAVDTSRLEPCLHIPPGTKALLVNNDYDTAVETVELLHALGVDHLDFIPYAPGREAPDGVAVAVTPGMSRLVPSHMSTVIDLGIRSIDISTLVEIAVALGRPLHGANFLAPGYARFAIESMRRHIETSRHLASLNRLFETILNSIQDAVITTDANGHIQVINASAARLFHLRPSEAIGRSLSIMLDNPGSLDFRENLSADDERLVSIGGKHYLASRVPIVVRSRIELVVMVFRDTSDLQRSEVKIRQQLRPRGFVARYSFDDIITGDDHMQSTLTLASRIALTDLPVLILGESGTGKEMVAHSVHLASARRKGPFVAANLAALPESLLESELFGYEEGAFTGARRGGRAGLFEEAHTGTIFLDEIGDLSPSTQGKLLRALQEKEVTRLGGNRIIPVDVRIIAATNRIEISSGRTLRRDLYFRLASAVIHIPPLRERKADVPKLLRHFLKRNGLDYESLPPEALALFESHDWPGNIRELQNAASFICSLRKDSKIPWSVVVANLPLGFRKNGLRAAPAPEDPALSPGERSMPYDHHQDTESTLRELQATATLEDFRLVLQALANAERSGGRAGRDGIAAFCCGAGRALTPQQVRHRLSVLERLGAVTTGRGRQASWMTPLGREILSLLARRRSQHSDSMENTYGSE
jgi:PAS domain S-box-containing protein